MVSSSIFRFFSIIQVLMFNCQAWLPVLFRMVLIAVVNTPVSIPVFTPFVTGLRGMLAKNSLIITFKYLFYYIYLLIYKLEIFSSF